MSTVRNSEFISHNVSGKIVNGFDRSYLLDRVISEIDTSYFSTFPKESSESDEFWRLFFAGQNHVFNSDEQLVSESVKAFSGLICSQYYSRLADDFSELKLESADGVPIQLGPYLLSLRKAERLFEKHPAIETLKGIVNAFWDLSVNVVFNSRNINLSDEYFRKSSFFNGLLCPFELKEEDSEKAYHHYEYTLNDPFVAAALVRIYENIRLFKNMSNNESTNLSRLKIALFARLAEKSFNRFLFISGETYRLTLNRHLSKFLACPRSSVSSIEEIKPLRLFEKIKSYILQKYPINEKHSNATVKVCLIGHTEASVNSVNGSREAELLDLLDSLLVWYSAVNKNGHIDIYINSFVNSADYSAVDNRRFEKITEKVGLNCGYIQVDSIDYDEKFHYTTEYLMRLINENDIVFLLDCPWLTKENFEIDKSVSMNYFCDELFSYPNGGITDMRLDSEQHTIMEKLDAQYNRIMASNTFDSGKICRVLKDYIPQRIQKKLSEYSEIGEKKAVYLFLSESSGNKFSYLVSFPLQRVESYEGKLFNIFQFCSYSIPKIDITDLSKITKFIDIKLRLWSIIKQISVAYAFEYFRDVLQKILPDMNGIDYFSVYRGTIVIVRATYSTPIKVSVSVKFSEYIYKTFSETQRKVWHDEVMSLILPLYKDIIFAPTDGIGDTYIRRAFSVNLYSGANDIFKMYIWHRYRMADLNKDFRPFDFVGEADDDNRKICEEIEEIDFFKDRWIYDIVLRNLESTGEMTRGQKYIINNDAPSIYRSGYYSPKEFLSNLLAVYRVMGAQDSELYSNTEKALSDL